MGNRYAKTCRMWLAQDKKRRLGKTEVAL